MQTSHCAPRSLQLTLAARAHDGPVSLTFPPDRKRFSLRLAPAHLALAGEAFAIALPSGIGEASGDDGRRALCLGPDEWVLYTDEAEGDAVISAFAGLYARAPHSLVDISDREIAVSIEGAQAATLLSVGCAMDLRDMPVGSGRRTVFDGATVVLHRDGEHAFGMDVWRSFLPHVWDLLCTGNRELASGF